MKSKAIEILRAIAEDNNNPSHSNMSLAQQAAVKVALHELEQPEPTVVHPLLEVLNTHIRKLVDERVEHAVNATLKETEEQITALGVRVDDLDSLESRIDDIESDMRNNDDDKYNDLENRIEDLESTQGDHEDAIDELQKSEAALLRQDTRTDEWSHRMEQRLETLENATRLTTEDILLACSDYISDKIRKPQI